MDNVFRTCCRNYRVWHWGAAGSVSLRKYVGALRGNAPQQHHHSQVQICTWMSECSHGIFAVYCLFSELLLPRTGPMPWSRIITLLLEVAESRKVVWSGGSRHHMFHLPAKCTHLDALYLKVLKRSKHHVCVATVNSAPWAAVYSSLVNACWEPDYTHAETWTHLHVHTHTAGQWPKGCGCAQHLPAAKLWMYPSLSSLLWTNMFWLVSVFIIFVLLLVAQLDFNQKVRKLSN